MTNTDLKKTPSQTIGPFFKFGTEWIAHENVFSGDYPNSITIKGSIYDGEGNSIPDGMIELWQADENGLFPPDTAKNWMGFARRLTDDAGQYEINTVKPASVKAADGSMQAPHIFVVLFARGLLKPVMTRIYFADEEEANNNDPLLLAISDINSKKTLIAKKVSDSVYEFNIHLQDSSKGPETLFVNFGA